MALVVAMAVVMVVVVVGRRRGDQTSNSRSGLQADPLYLPRLPLNNARLVG